MKKLLLIPLALLLVMLTALPVLAADEMFLPSSAVTAEHCANMVSWAGDAGATASIVGGKVQIGTTTGKNATFWFPDITDAGKMNFTNTKYIEVSVKNTKSFGYSLAVFITENATGTEIVEHWQIKKGAKIYMKDAAGKVSKLEDEEGFAFYVPGNFDGKFYIPAAAEYWEVVKWATIDGKLDMTKINRISYAIPDDSKDAQFIIGDSRKTDYDPAADAGTPAAPTSSATAPAVSSAAPPATSSVQSVSSPDTPSSAAAGSTASLVNSNSTGGEGSSTQLVIVSIVAAVAVLAAAGEFVFIYIKVLKKKPEAE